MPEFFKSCISCCKDDNRTGKPCPTRSGCFTPNYKEWEPIGEGPKQQDGIHQVLLDLKLNGQLEFEHGRYIRVPGGWIFETNREVAICFIPEPK